MLNHTYVVDRHALLVDRYRPNETRKKLEHKSRRKTWRRFSFGKAHVRHALEGRCVKSDTPRTLN